MISSKPRRGKLVSLPACPLLTAVMIVVALAQIGCASKSQIMFRCDPRVNSGNVLTIDLIEVDDAEVQQIQGIGYDWFYSDLRRQLAHRIKTITVNGSCSTTIDLSQLGVKEKVLRKKKGKTKLAVIAEYQMRHRDGNMLFLSYKQWKGKTVKVQVHDTTLTIIG